MTNKTKRFILLQAILFILSPVSLFGQSEYAIKQKIQESLDEFMSMISYVNDEEEVITPSMIATRYSGGNYFRFNGKEMKLQNFIEDYCYSDLKRQIVNHSLSISPNNITKVSNNPSDRRWTVNGILKRGYATNKQDNISDESIKFIILWRGVNEEIGLLDLDFHSVPRMAVSNVTSQIKDVSQTNIQSDYSEYINKAIEKLEAGDCVAAQKFYNMYKELSGQTSSNLEKRLIDCLKEDKQTYHIGDIMPMTYHQNVKFTYLSGKEENKEFKNQYKGRIAFLEDGGEHGFAVYYIGPGHLTQTVEFGGKVVHSLPWPVPSLSEFQLMMPNIDILGIKEGEEFWTSSSNDAQNYRCIKFIQDNKTTYTYRDKDKENSGILILSWF